MNREELKKLWLSLPKQVNKIDIKAITVCAKTFEVARITDTSEYYSKASSNHNTLDEAMDRARLYKSDDYYYDYDLIIK